MEFITLRGRKLDSTEIEISIEAPAEGVAVGMAGWMELPPVLRNGHSTKFSQSVAQILSQIADEEASAKAGRPVSSSIMPPDPWLVTLAYLMWEGVVQGVAWDVAKLTLQNAIGFMQSRGIAPRDRTQRKSERDVHFGWSGYIEWEPLKNLFVKLEVHYDKQTRTSSESDTDKLEK